jgi:hypothetical protein
MKLLATYAHWVFLSANAIFVPFDIGYVVSIFYQFASILFYQFLSIFDSCI